MNATLLTKILFDFGFKKGLFRLSWSYSSSVEHAQLFILFGEPLTLDFNILFILQPKHSALNVLLLQSIDLIR